MSREIKFRGWYTGPHVNRMLEPNFNGPVNEIFNDPDNEGKVIYMQYTGLKDKHGTEIYERDIVKAEMPVISVNEDFIGRVEMFEGRWWIDNGHDAIPLWSETYEITVLGNVFENLELLEALT